MTGRAPRLGAAGLPALRGLLHPRAQGTLRAAHGARRQPARRRRCRGGLHGRLLLPRPRPRRPDPRRRRDRVDRWPRRCATGADDPDATDGGAVQRCRWRRGRAGGAARARAPRRRRRAGSCSSATAFTIVVGSISFSGSVVTFAKLQELMTSRPVVFPGLPVVFGGALVAALALSVLTVTSPSVPVGVVLRPGGPERRGAAGAAGRRRRRTHRDLAAQRLHRPHRRRGRLCARQHAAAGGGHPGRRGRHVPHPADGRRDGPLGGQHPLRRAQGRLDAGRREVPPTGRCAPPGRGRARSCWATPHG